MVGRGVSCSFVVIRERGEDFVELLLCLMDECRGRK